MAVLFVLIVIGFVLVVALRVASSDLHDSALQSNSVHALMLAESALERASFRFSSGTACNGLAEGPINLGNGNFTVSNGFTTDFDGVTPLAAGRCRIPVIGSVGTVQRRVQAIVQSAGGALAVEDDEDNGTTSSVNTLTIANVTVGGTGRVLVVGVSIDSAQGSVGQWVRYAGQDLTRRVFEGTGNRPRSEIWSLANPPTGTASVQVTLTGNDQLAAGAVVFTGVDTTTATSHLDVAAVSDSGNNDTSASVTITPVTAGAWLFDTVTVNGGPTVSMTAMTGRLQRWNRRLGGSITGAGSTLGPVSPAAARTLRWTWSGGERWAQAAIALRPGGSPQLVAWREVPN
jgi:type II secretory pathway pseudopilin PulG